MKSIIYLLSVCLVMNVAWAADFVVASTGADSNPGTVDRPFATLTRARDALRTRIASGAAADLTVLVRGGTYHLETPLEFDARDTWVSGPHTITYAAYPDETPVLSGGVAVSGWTVGADHIWRATLPAVAAGAFLPRGFFIGGQRRPRAASPNGGAFFSGAASTDGLAFTFPAKQLSAWKHPHEVELLFLREWTATRVRFRSITLGGAGQRDAATLTSNPLLFLHQDWGVPIQARTASQLYRFENAAELVDAAGEWHVERDTGVLSYLPMPGEAPTQLTSVVPRLSALVNINGTITQPVRQLCLSGFTFAHTNDPLPAGDSRPVQAGFGEELAGKDTFDYQKVWHNSAVLLSAAQGCRIEHCRFTNLGGHALSLGARCYANTVIGNLINDIGANGVSLIALSERPDDLSDIPRDNVIEHNLIHHCGVDVPGSVGIFLGLTANTRVANNEIHSVPYSGISNGWCWDARPTSCTGITIERNHLHHTHQLLDDGGAIYSLGWQPGGVLRGNHLHDVAKNGGRSANNGIFLDDKSAFWRLEQNLVYATTGEPFRLNNNQMEDHTWGENFFGVAPDAANFPSAIVDQAGPQEPYRSALRQLAENRMSVTRSINPTVRK